MRSILRAFRWVMTMVLAGAVSTVPACGTMGGGGMGGGGMHYFTDPPSASAGATA